MSSTTPATCLPRPRRLPLVLDAQVLDPARVVLRVSGELDLLTVEQFRDRLTALVSGAYDHVDVDLSGVSFCDVVALGALLAAHRAQRARGATLTVHDPCSSLLAMLRALNEPALNVRLTCVTP